MRERNEDNYLVAELRHTLNVVDSSVSGRNQALHTELGALLAVADGVGSVRGGEVASAMALDALAEYVLGRIAPEQELNGDPPTFAEGVRGALKRCQSRMAAVAVRKGLDPRMATTLTAAHLRWPLLSLFHVGDSRAYLYREGQLRQLTRDDTVAQDLVDRGVATSGALEGSPMAHTLTSCIGGGRQTIEVQHRLLRLEIGDLLLLCSDGLHGEVSERTVQARLAAVEDDSSLGRCVDELIGDAMAAGGADNVTVVLAYCRSDRQRVTRRLASSGANPHGDRAS